MQRLKAGTKNFKFIIVLNTVFLFYVMAENKNTLADLVSTCIALAKQGKNYSLVGGGSVYFKSLGVNGFVEYWDGAAVNASKKELNVWWDSSGKSPGCVFDAKVVLDDFDGHDYCNSVFIGAVKFGVKSYLKKGEWEETITALRSKTSSQQ